MPESPLSIGFDVPFAEAIAAALARGVVLPAVYYHQLQGLARQLAFSIAGIASIEQLQAVRDSLTKALQTGQSFNEWMNEAAVMNLNLPDHRLDNIWRTNLQGNYMRGEAEQLLSNTDNRPYWLYDSINDSRTRPSHLAMDGTIRRYDDPWWSTHFPPNGYRSILPYQPVSGQFMLGLKAAYSGPSVKIRTRRGHHLSLTTNHPVLTNRGWIGAHNLREGDALLRYCIEVDECADIPCQSDNYHFPSTAEQVFEAMRQHGSAFAPRAAFNLNGDIEFIQGDVEVVAANSALLCDIHSEFLEFTKQFDLARTGSRKTLLSSVCDLFSNSLSMSDFGIFSRCISDFFKSSFNAMSFNGGLISIEFDPVLYQVLRDPISGYPKLGGKLPNRPPIGVHTGQFVGDRITLANRHLQSSSLNGEPIYFGFGPLRNSRISHIPIGGHITNSHSHADLHEAHPGFIEIDHVSDIAFSYFSGHVYDFQTKTGLIISPDSGLVFSNCRCSVISLTEAQARARTGTDKEGRGTGLNKQPLNADGSRAEPDKGWDYNPYEDQLKVLLQVLEERKTKAGPVLGAAIAELISAIVSSGDEAM